MKKVALILFLGFIGFSFQLDNIQSDFSTPKMLIETFLQASANGDKITLSKCFSDESPSEWDAIRDQTISEKRLQELQEFVSEADILKVEMHNDQAATVHIHFKTRDEEIKTMKEEGRWFILDF